MSVYTVALFFHILGVLGLFAGTALDWTTILRLRRVQSVALVREVTSLVPFQSRLTQISLLLILIAGVYMTVKNWEWSTPWILPSLGALVVMGALGGGVIGRRLAVIRNAAAASDGTIPPALQRQTASPVLLTTSQTSGMIGLGVVFLMTIKPDLLTSLIALAVALVLGVLSAQLWPRPRVAAAPVKEA